HCDLGNLGRVANTRRADLDDLSCDDLGERIVSVNKMQRAQSLFEGRVQVLDFIDSQLAVGEQAVDRHPHSPAGAFPLQTAYQQTREPQLTHVSLLGTVAGQNGYWKVFLLRSKA